MAVTAEQAAQEAAELLHRAAEAVLSPDVSDALVGVADGWTNLYLALAGAPKVLPLMVHPPEHAPGEPAEIASLPAEVRALVHAVDAMRDQWAESDEARRGELWQRVHAASDAVWAGRR